MTTRIELPLPHYVGKPQTLTAKCCECEAVATATIEFVAFAVDAETREPLGMWAPAIYECPAGHITMESEAEDLEDSLSFAEADELGLVDWSDEDA
jgi:hypothetical protein